MKINTALRTPKRLSFAVFATLLALVLAFMVSCSKNDNQASSSAFIMAANTSQGSVSQDFYVDNNKVNASALAYTQSSGYAQVTPGDSHQGQFKASSTSTVDATFSAQLAPGAFYTAYYTDGSNATVYQNDRTSPQGGNARVRFINLSSSVTSNIDVVGNVGGSSTSIVLNLAAKAASNYYEIATLSNTFSLKASGSSSVLLSVPVVLQAGKIYTIVLSGATSATLAYSLITEN